MTGGTPVALSLYGIQTPISDRGLDCITHFVASMLEFNHVTISAISYLLENPKPIIISLNFLSNVWLA